jgi:hypothetical protein
MINANGHRESNLISDIFSGQLLNGICEQCDEVTPSKKFSGKGIYYVHEQYFHRLRGVGKEREGGRAKE